MPASHTPSFAKNIIARSLRTLVDPSPTSSELRRLADHFSHRCAFCETMLHSRPKDAQLDHLDPNGSNGVWNRVYACENCNEKEKRDMPWKDFLRSKATNPTDYSRHEALILTWIQSNAANKVELDHEWNRIIKSEIETVTTAFDAAVARIRALRQACRE
jgi:hypothetical protein